MSTLYDLIPKDGRPGNDALLGRFLEYVEGRRLQLYPAQETAILGLFEEKNVILNTPTGSGKSLVAAALHFKSIAYELLWFLRGESNVRYLREHGVTIWDEWADERGELGPVYGYQWRSWPAPDGRHIDQLGEGLAQIRERPSPRRRHRRRHHRPDTAGWPMAARGDLAHRRGR